MQIPIVAGAGPGPGLGSCAWKEQEWQDCDLVEQMREMTMTTSTPPTASLWSATSTSAWMGEWTETWIVWIREEVQRLMMGTEMDGRVEMDADGDVHGHIFSGSSLSGSGSGSGPGLGFESAKLWSSSSGDSLSLSTKQVLVNMYTSLLVFLFSFAGTQLEVGNALAERNTVGKLPALGWNSWNAFNCDVDEAKIMTAASQMVTLGLKDAGYEYVNIDDCWSIKSGRNSTTKQIIPDPTKFPDGISGTADKIHALGLKIGIYSSAGTQTCAGYPASIGYEDIDAATFAAWGIDYLKYDNCNIPQNWTDTYTSCVPEYNWVGPNGTCPGTTNAPPPGYDWSTSNSAERFRRMRDALMAQNRTILYSLCEWGYAEVWSWGNETGSSWRTTGDIEPNWDRITTIMNENSFLLNTVNFWGHGDADMLEVGNGDLTLEENRSHFAFWAAMKSPVIIGTSLDTIAQNLVDILSNRYLLGFSQDGRYGAPAMPYKWGVNPDWTFNATNPAEYWSGPSEMGTLVLAFNSLSVAAEREILWSEVPELSYNGNGGFEATDIWSGKALGCISGGISRNLTAHDTMGFMITGTCEGGGGGHRRSKLGRQAFRSRDSL
ncbi:hypothetical protein EG329_006315 [Mollisiaceae sp. DMI_Dod_QoI]|nr:hypothetical protein EG329_006315 [Helotiales sp. DMI_Dod_QoI]